MKQYEKQLKYQWPFLGKEFCKTLEIYQLGGSDMEVSEWVCLQEIYTIYCLKDNNLKQTCINNLTYVSLDSIPYNLHL